MRVFVLDLSWRGGLVVLADSPEQAIEKLKAEGHSLSHVYGVSGGEYKADDLQELIPGKEETYRFFGDE